MRGRFAGTSADSISPAFSASGCATSRQLSTMRAGSMSAKVSCGAPAASQSAFSMPSSTPIACRALS